MPTRENLVLVSFDTTIVCHLTFEADVDLEVRLCHTSLAIEMHKVELLRAALMINVHRAVAQVFDNTQQVNELVSIFSLGCCL